MVVRGRDAGELPDLDAPPSLPAMSKRRPWRTRNTIRALRTARACRFLVAVQDGTAPHLLVLRVQAR
jgi:hypothetical protein